MKIVIAGAGSVGRSVALELLAHGHDITLIDNMPEKLRIATVADADWVLADACSPDALRDAGVEEADVVVAATGDDKANLVISLLSKTEFAVPRVVARLNNPNNEWLFDQAWGVDVSVSTPRIMTALVEEAVSIGIPVRLFSFNTAAVSMHALILPEDSPVVGRRVHSLELPPRSVLAALLRDGRPLTPSADDVFEASDELLLLVPDSDASALAARGRSVPVLGRGDGGRGVVAQAPPGGPGTEREERQTQGELGDAECRDRARGPQGGLNGDAQAKQTRPHPREQGATAAEGAQGRFTLPARGEAGKHRVEETDQGTPRED